MPLEKRFDMKCPMRACSSVSSKPFPGRKSSGSFGSEPRNCRLGAGPEVQRSLSPFEDLSSLGFLKFVFSSRLKFSLRVFILVQGSELNQNLTNLSGEFSKSLLMTGRREMERMSVIKVSSGPWNPNGP